MGYKDFLKFLCESVFFFKFFNFVSKRNLPGLFATRVMLIHAKPVFVL